MKSLSVKLGVILIGFFIFGYAEVWGADWKPYGRSDDYLGYYDAQRITRPSKNIVRVWLRWDWTEKSVLRFVGKFGREYENLSHSIMLNEINCAEKKIRTMSSHSYDNKGGAIDSLSDPSSKWDFIVTETMGEKLYKEVCK
jgi:hypothetical protein